MKIVLHYTICATFYVTAAYEISLCKTEAAIAEYVHFKNLTLPANVMKFYCIEVVIDVAERKKCNYL